MPFKTIKTIGAALAEMELISLDINELINSQKLNLEKEIVPDNILKIAFTTTSKETLLSLSALEEDTDEIVDHLMRIKGVNMCIYLREDMKKEFTKEPMTFGHKLAIKNIKKEQILKDLDFLFL